MGTRKRVRKAVIPAAGCGTRMLPATKAVPKEMLPVGGKPLIQLSVEEAVSSGIETIIIVTRPDRSILESHFNRNVNLEEYLRAREQSVASSRIDELSRLAEIVYVEQDTPVGLAHAISRARCVVGDEPFVVLLPDVIMRSKLPVTGQLMEAYDQQGGTIIAVREVEADVVERHGIVCPDQHQMLGSNHCFRVSSLIEKPSPAQTASRLGIFGRYILNPSIWEFIDERARDSSGELQLTNAIHLSCRNTPVYGYLFEGSCYDAGNPLGFLIANIEVTLENPTLRGSLLGYLAQFGTDQSLATGARIDIPELIPRRHS